ncbi:DNA helicase Pif1 like protein, partial [Lentinula edodes]
LMNSEQQMAFDNIMESVEKGNGSLFFLSGPSGTGKTFAYQALCHAIRAHGWITLCVASTGIAALLLPGGRTAHSMFKIPIDGLTEESLCNIPKQ